MREGSELWPGVLALAVASWLAVAPALAQSASRGHGVWRNPKNSVHVEIKPCGDKSCGYVVWASDKAKADAKRGGTDNLIGLQIFRDFSPGPNGNLTGKVFVPDLDHTFAGTAEFIDETTLKARGCLIGNLICKTQVWHRLD